MNSNFYILIKYSTARRVTLMRWFGSQYQDVALISWNVCFDFDVADVTGNRSKKFQCLISLGECLSDFAQKAPRSGEAQSLWYDQVMLRSSIWSNSIFAVFNFSGDKRLGRACTEGLVVIMQCVTLWFKTVLLNDGVVIVEFFFFLKVP